MGDHRIFVDNLRLSYEGAFVANDLFRTIFTYLYDKGYDQKPIKEAQYDTPTGKAMEWNAAPWKKITDYIRLEPNIRVIITDMVKKEMIVGKKKVLVDHGKVLIIINWYMETDYDMRFEDRPMFLFMRALYDKWVFKEYYQRYEVICTDHANQLYALMRRLLNTYSTHGMQTMPNSIALHD